MILRRRINSALVLLLSLFFLSCEKEEIPVQSREPGEALVNSVELGLEYKHQVYFNLNSNSVVSSNLKVDWDLSFESSPEGWRITLNTSRGMAAAKMDIDFSEAIDHSDAEWSWDAHSGNLDTTAFGDWQSETGIYVVDLGYTPSGTHMGYRKMKINSVSENDYDITFGNLDDPTGTSITVAKNTQNLMTFFSFENGVVNIAPENESYDLVFTQYTHLFTNPETPYLVTGVLLNRFETGAIKYEGDKLFEDLVRNDVESITLNTDLNTIGFDWKVYNYEDALFTVDPTVTYIIQTNKGLLYKLRFTGFYNEEGLKGYPNFEFQEL